MHQVVVHLWEKHEEVPYIAAYRKQLAGELRALHKRDQPRVTSEKDRSDAYPVGTVQVWPSQLAKVHTPCDRLGFVFMF